jgi:Response regulator containing CheY-like receiver, AAA-type ATPase, and DNA-binding domains
MPIRVLLVEDDTLTRRNTALYLRRAQIEVDEAADGNEAIRLITSIDRYDVIISDLRMPGRVDGMDIITHQQRVSPGTLCILVTAFGSDQVQRRAQDLAVTYLEKPISLPDLRSKVTAFASRHTP